MDALKTELGPASSMFALAPQTFGFDGWEGPSPEGLQTEAARFSA